MRLRVAVAIAVLAVVVIAAVWYARANGPQRAASAFLAAWEKGDREAFMPYLTRASQAAFTSGRIDASVNPQLSSSHRVADTQIEGDQATVKVVMKNDDWEVPGAVQLRKEQGEWRVYALSLRQSPSAPEATVDFEHPESTLAETMKLLPGTMEHVGKAIGAGLRGLAEGIQKGMQTDSPKSH